MPPKFIQLQVGQAFVFEGQAYVKSSPLMARSERTGQERFMPRSALVETGGEPAAEPAVTARTLPAEEVAEAWRAFKARLNDVAAAFEREGGTGNGARLRRGLAEAAAEFEQQLGVRGE